MTLNCEGNLAEEYEKLDTARGVFSSGKALIYREMDIINEDARVETDYYRNVYKPNNWDYSLQMILAKDKRFLGIITFSRAVNSGNSW